MNPDTVQRLVFAITQFLRQQVETSALPNSILLEEGAESVEVALQCLEAAYSVSQDSADLGVSTPLYNIFSQAIQGQTKVSSARTAAPPISAEDKNCAEVLKNEGNLLMRGGNFREAFEKYSKAIEKDNINAVYYSNRAAALGKLEKYHEAISDCKKALEIDPNYSKAYGRMGLAYSELDENVQATQCYQKALDLEPNNETYRSNLQVAEEKLRSCTTGGNTAAAAPPFNIGSFASLAGLDSSSSGPNVANLLNNPGLVNMASQLMSDPNMQNMMSSILGGFGGGAPGAAAPPPQPPRPTETAPTPPTTAAPAETDAQPSANPAGMNMDFLLSAGRQLAEQLEAQNPDLVEQLRNQVGRGAPRGDGNQTQPPP